MHGFSFMGLGGVLGWFLSGVEDGYRFCLRGFG